MSDLRAAIAAAYHADENLIAAERIGQAQFSPSEAAAVAALARDLAGRLRAEGGRKGGVAALT